MRIAAEIAVTVFALLQWYRANWWQGNSRGWRKNAEEAWDRELDLIHQRNAAWTQRITR